MNYSCVYIVDLKDVYNGILVSIRVFTWWI